MLRRGEWRRPCQTKRDAGGHCLLHVPGAAALYIRGAMMTQPREPIRMVRDALRANSGDIVVKAELKGRWLDEHPNAKDSDYLNHLTVDAGYNSSLESLRSSFDVSIRRLS